MVWGEGDDQLWGSGCGAIAGCHCSVPLLLGAIAGCHCSVLVEGKAKVNFGGGAIAGAIVVCHGWGGG